MIEPRSHIDRTPPAQNIELGQNIEISPDVQGDTPNFESVAATVRNLLRPPELQFDGESRLGTPRFEAQAIASMDMLKANPRETTLNNLSALLIEQGPDIEKNGSEAAKDGLRVLDEFMGLSAMLIAMNESVSG